jgi:hypothetical protein
VILGLLQSADEALDQASSAAEAVFPALDIIRRAGPPDEHRDELRRHIEEYLGSRIWHVREIAARTLCCFLLQGDWVAEIQRLLVVVVKSGSSTNRLHGVLLTARFVIERKADADLGVNAEELGKFAKFFKITTLSAVGKKGRLTRENPHDLMISISKASTRTNDPSD